MAFSKEDANAIFEQVRANSAKLNACPGPHDFSLEIGRTGSLVRTWGCAKCGGTVETLHKHWYERGLQHGRMSK